MSDTITARAAILGTITRGEGYEPVRAIQWQDERYGAACYDWNSDWTDMIPRFLSEPDYEPPRYTIPTSWTFVPTTPDEPFTPDGEETRESLGRALAAMRQREAEAIRLRDAAQQRATFANNQLTALRDRVEQLADALLEQAEERDWCSEYEEFQFNFSDLLKTREREYTVTLNITMTGRDVDNADIASHIYDMSSSDLRSAIYDWTQE